MKEKVIKKLHHLDQLALLNHPMISLSDRLQKEILEIDDQIIFKQKQLLKSSSLEKTYQPFTGFESYQKDRFSKEGKKLLEEGKVGCLVLAGGEGSRLQFNGPKGTFPISLVKKKSLFQLIAEKVFYASRLVKKKIPLAIMTSPKNDFETRMFFQRHQFFGLDPSQLFFFRQTEWPLLDFEGNLFLEEKDHLAFGSNGNGRVLHHFYGEKIWHQWKENGIEYVNLIPIDNPLALPLDCDLIGFHNRSHCQVVIKAIFRDDPHEKVGLIVEDSGYIKIIEYTELPLDEKLALNENGKLKHSCANITLFSFSMQFIEELAINAVQLPLHKVKKACKVLSPEGFSSLSKEPNAWKFEEYVFDLLGFAKNVKVLVFPRKHVFAPLKKDQGEDGIEAVQKSLQNIDIHTYCTVSGIDCNQNLFPTPFELSQEFYYPSEEFVKKWEGKLPDKNYMENEKK